MPLDVREIAERGHLRGALLDVVLAESTLAERIDRADGLRRKSCSRQADARRPDRARTRAPPVIRARTPCHVFS